MSAREICLSGVHNTPIDNIVIDRAIAAPLSLVKAWVLRDHHVDWQSFSTSLREAPLNERVAICVFSKRDGSPFTMPPGIYTPQPQEAIVEIIRPDGGGALYLMGSTTGMLVVTPRSLRELRRLVA